LTVKLTILPFELVCFCQNHYRNFSQKLIEILSGLKSQFYQKNIGKFFTRMNKFSDYGKISTHLWNFVPVT
jgi:hypothetical protein